MKIGRPTLLTERRSRAQVTYEVRLLSLTQDIHSKILSEHLNKTDGLAKYFRRNSWEIIE